MLSQEQRAAVARALEFDGMHGVDDVAARIEAGTAQIWHRDAAVIVTEVLEYPRGRVVHFWLAAGDLEPVRDLSEEVLRWAREVAGCVRATLVGRKGWGRVLGGDGWETEATLMGRRLNGEE